MSEYENINFINIRKNYEEYFINKKSSDYIANKALRALFDALLLRNKNSIDKKSESRGLYYTLDGVHFNSKGAEIYASAILEAIDASYNRLS